MKHLIVFLFASMFVISCSKSSLIDHSAIELDHELLALSTNGIAQSFMVTIENITSEGTFVTPFAPGLWAVQKKNSTPIFMDGSPDFGEGLENLAEDGMPGILNASLANDPKVRSRGMFNTPNGQTSPAPIFPGDSYSFQITAKPNDYLNFATMFIQSNDLFVGPEDGGISLFDSSGNAMSGDVTGYLSIWDAGTEVNEEPGVGPNQAPRQSGPNTGIDEHGVVHEVNDGYDYPAVSDMLKVTIHPMN